MLKSPEQYLSGLTFNAIDPDKDHLSAGERAFVEKYLGLDALGALPRVEPEAVPLPALLPEEQKRKPALVVEPQIIVVSDSPAPETAIQTRAQVEVAEAKAPIRLEIAEKEPQEIETAAVACTDQAPTAVVAQDSIAEKTVAVEASETVLKTKCGQQVVNLAQTQTIEQEETATKVATAAPETELVDVAEKIGQKTDAIAPVQTPVPPSADVVKLEQAQEETVAPAVAKTQLTPEQALKEKWRKDAEIQMVSFLVGGQIFLLPVEGILEVVRHMELIKVPQAPYFVAGVINLRGNVTPIVHLTALLTNAEVKEYNERNFIIITGTEKLKIGLIIDKVSSMHMIPQNKIIWNPESKLAEAAEFLNAIVDLDDHVCGMVAPENITRLILPDLM